MNNGVIIQWLGDISLNGPFCDPQHAAALAENLRSIADELGPCDLRIANWEAPLWGDGGMNERKAPRLATLPQAVRAVQPLGLDVALLANNHVYDCLEAGFENTVTLLREMGVATLGAGRSEQEAAEPLVIERKGLRLGLLNYVGRETHPNLPPGAPIFLNWFEEEHAFLQIAALRAKTDAVLVHVHWGSFEFLRMPTVEQRRIARRLIEAGATVVAGGHAHVFQGHEPWSNGYIFHGTGNFLFWPPKAPLEQPCPWPRFVREVGVAGCRLADGKVNDVAIRHLIQEGLALRWDETPGRKRMERRLCRSLRLSEHSFSWARRLNSFYEDRILSRLHTMHQEGGLLPWVANRCARIFRVLL